MPDFLILLSVEGFGHGRSRREPLSQAQGGEAPCLAYLTFANGRFRLECGGDPPETVLLPTVPSHLVAGEHDGMGMAWHGMARRPAKAKHAMTHQIRGGPQDLSRTPAPLLIGHSAPGTDAFASVGVVEA